MNYLNLGCGQRFHPNWTNIDFRSTSPSIIAHNLIQGIPKPDGTFDVVYHSHLLEHFSKDQGKAFIQECSRVLKPGGTIRIAIPDLERIAKIYLDTLEQAQSGSSEASENHYWMVIEMLDQSVRNHSGGAMADYLFQKNIPNQTFILDRIGTEGRKLIEAGKQQYNQQLASRPNWLRPIYRFIRHPSYRRNALHKLFLNQFDYEALQIGRFRLSGEIHQWMYDRHSLTQLLQQSNLIDITPQTATTSKIPNWQTFNLDTEPDGSIYKPDSLFMEATKPE
jgi:predicted SAM-dependent methyltransferase